MKHQNILMRKIHKIINKFKELNIFTGLILLIALPLLGLIDLSIEKFYNQLHNYRQAIKIDNITNLNVVIDNFIHNLQRERGMSHMYLGRSNKKSEENLMTFQKESDNALRNLREWRNYLSEQKYDLAELDNLLYKTEQIDSIRAQIFQKKINIFEVFSFYTGLIHDFVNYKSKLIKQIENKEVITLLFENFITFELREVFGQERALISYLVATKNQKGNEEIKNELYDIINAQNIIEDLFLKLADRENVDYYKNTVMKMNFEQIRQWYINQNSTNDLEQKWWDIATLRISYLNFILQKNVNKIMDISQHIKKKSQEKLFISSVQLVATFIITLLIILKFKNYIEKQIFHDILTELPNRRFLKKHLPCILNQAERYSKPFSILILDIDDFKRINDTYGHDIGDILLQKLAKVIKRNLRKSDLPVRIGGEEFLIILPNTNIEDTVKVSDRIRKAFSEIEIEVNGEIVKTTLSGGIASYEKGLDFDTLYKRADIALYRAKSLGKNRIEVYELNSTGGQS
ncbi:MAG: diguanylate cyclase [Thermodesulfovibrio sp.]|nr:diguanylate cyclase [Thermodesulfovibrio sp.]